MKVLHVIYDPPKHFVTGSYEIMDPASNLAVGPSETGFGTCGGEAEGLIPPAFGYFYFYLFFKKYDFFQNKVAETRGET